MPIVAPKVKVVRVVQQGIAPPPIIINPSTGQPYPRFGPYVDLGILRTADIMAAGYLTVLPETPGLFVTRIFFSRDGLNVVTNSYVVYAPHTWQIGFGLGFVESQFVTGTISILAANFSSLSEAFEPTPIVVAPSLSFQAGQILNIGSIRSWTPATKYAATDTRLAAGRVWGVTTGGTSDAVTEPDWSGASPITDGTVTWTLLYEAEPVGQFHALAEVVNFPGLDIPRPASLEFFQQPTDVVAGVAFDPVVQVRVLDQHGQPYSYLDYTGLDFSGFGVQIAVLGAGVFSGATTLAWLILASDPTTGIVTFSTLGMGATESGTYQLVATTGIHTGIGIPLRVLSNSFTVTPP